MAITINNSANITYNYGTSSDSAVSNVATTLLAENYSLSAEKTSQNSSWRSSENITYLVRVTNTGSEPLYNVNIQDNLGGNINRLLVYVEGSARMLRNNVLTSVTPTSIEPITLTVPDTLEPGEVVIFSYIAKVKSDIDDTIMEITNEASVIGHEVSASGPTITVNPNPSLTLPKANYAQVRVLKTVDKDNIVVGDTITYTFMLENSGNSIANNVVLTDALPENFVIESITSLTNGTLTTFDTTDYSIDEENKLVLPTSATTKTISVPAKTINGNGITTVTIVGQITA